jgi:hypothetical protein
MNTRHKELIQDGIRVIRAAESELAITGTPSSSFIKAKAIEVGKEGILSCTRETEIASYGERSNTQLLQLSFNSK